MYNGPCRGGVRGGRDLFQWESLKGDNKHRENYLGHSLFTTNHKCFNNSSPNALWWMKSNDEKKKEQDKRLFILEQQDRMMKEELGLVPKSNDWGMSRLDKDEYKKLVERGTHEQEEGTRVTGIGFGQEKRQNRDLLELKEKN